MADLSAPLEPILQQPIPQLAVVLGLLGGDVVAHPERVDRPLVAEHAFQVLVQCLDLVACRLLDRLGDGDHLHPLQLRGAEARAPGVDGLVLQQRADRLSGKR